MCTTIGECIHYDYTVVELNAEDLAFSKRLWALMEGLLVEGKVVSHTVRVKEGGHVKGGARGVVRR